MQHNYFHDSKQSPLAAAKGAHQIEVLVNQIFVLPVIIGLHVDKDHSVGLCGEINLKQAYTAYTVTVFIFHMGLKGPFEILKLRTLTFGLRYVRSLKDLVILLQELLSRPCTLLWEALPQQLSLLPPGPAPR